MSLWQGRAAPVYSDDVLLAADGGHHSRGRGNGAINIPGESSVAALGPLLG